MKYYQLRMIITLLLWSLQADSFWSKWIDTIAAKITNSTDLIVHKEFDHAKKLELHNLNGSIVIHSWKQNSIAVEVIISCPEPFHKDIKVDMECIDDIVTINTIVADEKIKGSVLFNILVPTTTNISIVTKQGNISLKDVSNTIDIKTGYGDISIINARDTIQAITEHGTILIQTDYIEKSKESTMISYKGNIELYTTQTINSYIQASALQGKVISDIPITLDSQTTTLDAKAWKKFKQMVHGTIGNHESKINIVAHNGSISIMPYLQQNTII